MRNQLKCISALLLVLCLLFGLAGCGKDAPQPEERAASADAARPAQTGVPDKGVAAADKGADEDKEFLDALASVKKEDHISIEDAYDRLLSLTAAAQENQQFVRMLKDLMDCSGKFVQVSEDSDRRYLATVEFYLSGGTPWCAIEYSGFLGTIGDAPVEPAETGDYPFHSEPKGDLYGRELDFSIFFSNERLHIMWGDTCDYVLTRGDGSAEFLQDYEPPYDETDQFKAVVAVIDSSFSENPHEVIFDRATSTLNIYLQSPDNIKAGLNTKNEEILNAWGSVRESMENLCNSLYIATAAGGSVEDVNLFMVEHLRDGGSYIMEDIILWIKNGTTIYDYTDPTTVALPGSTDK